MTEGLRMWGAGQDAAGLALASSRAPLFQPTLSAQAGQYRSGFAKWYERASVRRSPRRMLREDTEHALFFPPELVPVAAHPLVVGCGPAAVRSILIQRLHQYMQFTVELEATAVVPITSDIGRGRSGLDLPDGMGADALKIATDEAWHAQFSYDLMAQVAAATGVEPRIADVPAFVSRLDDIHDRLDPALRGASGLLFAVVSETLISAILADLPHDKRLPRAVRDVVADHAEDEGKHHTYFRALLELLWPALDRDQRRLLGPWVPRMVWAFLEPDYRAIGESLMGLGLTAEQIEQVLQESYTPDVVSRSVAAAARSTVRYFRDVGALDDLETRDAFMAAKLTGTPDE